MATGQTRKLGVTLVDALTRQLEATCTERVCESGFRRATDELSDFTAAYAAALGFDDKVELTGAEAAEFMDGLISAWSGLINDDAPWSPVKALYIQRRFPIETCWSFISDPSLPDEFVYIATTGTERLLTVLNGSLRDQTEPTVGDASATGVAFDVSVEDVIQFLQRVNRTQHLWLMQNTARIVGKGGDLSFRFGSVPDTKQSEAVSEAMALFDMRQRATGEIAVVGTRAWDTGTTKSPSSIGWWYYAPNAPLAHASQALLSRVGRSAQKGRPVRHSVRFLMEMRDLAPFRELVADQGRTWIDPEVPALFLLLYALARFDEVALQWSLGRVGYVRVEREMLLGYIVSALREADPILIGAIPSDSVNLTTVATRIIASLMRIRGELWPTIEGPIIHSTADGALFVDAVAACNRLRARLTLGKLGGGPAANARGYSFEDAVQRTIDQAGFGPPRGSLLRELRARQLTRSGRTITDVDAVLLLEGGNCFFIQVKSYPYTESYAAGRYKDVRNLMTKVLTEAPAWREKVAELLASNPTERQNFSIPKDVHVEPLFVLPFAPYLLGDIAGEEAAPGLPYICSLGELQDFLATHVDRPED